MYIEMIREYGYEDYMKFVKVGRVVENNLTLVLFPISVKLKEEILSKSYDKACE